MTSALIVDAVILFAVLEADLGVGRRVSTFRLLRPLLLAAGIVPMFIEPVVTHGNGLTLEVALAGLGVVLGIVAAQLIKVTPTRSGAVATTRAGYPYAALWATVIGARAAFSFGATHWFGGSLEHWQIVNQISTAAITDALVFQAVAMLLTRTGLLALRAHGSRGQSAVARPGAAARLEI